jgi:hypothetical protein
MKTKKSLVYLLLLVVLLTIPAISQQGKPSWPRIEQVAQYGCGISEVDSTNAIRGGWYVTVWVDYKDQEKAKNSPHHWMVLHAVEEKRSKAFKACDDWMVSIEDAIRDAQKEKGR